MTETATVTAEPFDRDAAERQLAELRERRAKFEQAAWKVGDDNNACSTFDNYLSELGMQRRPQQYSVTVVRGIERTIVPVTAQYATITVRAQSETEAFALADAQLADGADNIGWRNARESDTATYLPETHPSSNDQPNVVIAPRRYGTDPA